MLLSSKHPDLLREFRSGNFVVQRSEHKFSCMGKDQSHEQSNKKLQSAGGLSDLYDEPDTLALYMLSTPDMLRIIEEFELVLNTESKSTKHHEEAHSLQVKFLRDVKSLTTTLSQQGNPFRNKEALLVTLHTREVMDEVVTASLCQVLDVGKKAHDEFVSKRLVECSVPIGAKITKKNVYTFHNRPLVKQSKGKKSAQQNTALTTKLFMSLEARPELDAQEFFSFENQREPPSLSDKGLMRSGKKSDILKCMNVPNSRSENTKNATVSLYDMPGVVHAVAPSNASTFKDYISLNLQPYVKAQVHENLQEMRLLWDEYPDDSLKIQTHEKRGTGPRTQIGEDGSTMMVPKGQWPIYISNKENKTELFHFASDQLIQSDIPVLVLSTKGNTVQANREYDVSQLSPCNHAEADTKILLHLAHAYQNGHRKAYTRSVDCDVVAGCTSHYG